MFLQRHANRSGVRSHAGHGLRITGNDDDVARAKGLVRTGSNHHLAVITLDRDEYHSVFPTAVFMQCLADEGRVSVDRYFAECITVA